jgi:hypothetical protein
VWRRRCDICLDRRTQDLEQLRVLNSADEQPCRCERESIFTSVFGLI